MLKPLNFPEENCKFCQVKCFGFIHATCEDFRSISQEIINRFYHSLSAHVRGDTRLVSKLKIIKPKKVTKQNDDQPINLFEPEACDADTSEVFRGVDTTEFIFYIVDEGSNENEVREITMNQEALDQSGIVKCEKVRLYFETV